MTSSAELRPCCRLLIGFHAIKTACRALLLQVPAARPGFVAGRCAGIVGFLGDIKTLLLVSHTLIGDAQALVALGADGPVQPTWSFLMMVVAQTMLGVEDWK